jgi:hexosaminidase
MIPTVHLIPQPQELKPGHGLLVLGPESAIACAGPGARELGDLLAEYLRPVTGLPLPVHSGETAPRGGFLLTTAGAGQADAAGFCDETYRCRITSAGARLSAATPAGLARAVQTVRQLLPAAPTAGLAAATHALPALEIRDWPRFRWRGLHLDVSRHFFTLAEVCRFIDLAALHRFSVVHLHLSDDQGWRLEIRTHPRLARVGSRRACTLVGHEGARPRRYDGRAHGGFYSQAEVRQLVAFAARRHVTLVPEIDMPGHMQAAISAYPELGNTRERLPPRCHWGISQHILNVEEKTVRVMQDVLAEVMELFPGRFVHLGGDEAVKHEWAESPRVQERMRELGLRDEHELQSWFIRRMTEFVTAAGRRVIGWDEILEGGLAPGAAVMSWRGEEGGITAAQMDHDVVMAPGQHVYFDHYQAEPLAEEPLAIGGLTTTAHVYAYEPIPARLPAAKHAHVLGAQGQLWSEYIGDAAHLDYMAYPRACALAEVLWLPPEQRNYRSFLARLTGHRRLLAALGVNAHPLP